MIIYAHLFGALFFFSFSYNISIAFKCKPLQIFVHPYAHCTTWLTSSKMVRTHINLGAQRKCNGWNNSILCIVFIVLIFHLLPFPLVPLSLVRDTERASERERGRETVSRRWIHRTIKIQMGISCVHNNHTCQQTVCISC